MLREHVSYEGKSIIFEVTTELLTVTLKSYGKSHFFYPEGNYRQYFMKLCQNRVKPYLNAPSDGGYGVWVGRAITERAKHLNLAAH